MYSCFYYGKFTKLILYFIFCNIPSFNFFQKCLCFFITDRNSVVHIGCVNP
uniref:Uncharacterized protein n=1 Tax=Anguilla anguilla TaxID=7936 RepID=A0A0E9RCV9_ANGAN